MPEKNKYIVYEHVFPNGKKYIGITKTDPNIRWAHGGGYRTQTLVYRAINKYGWDNIQHNILFQDLSASKAKEIERQLISQQDLTNPEKGYNNTIGGEGGSKYLDPEDRKKARNQNSKKYYESHKEHYQKYREINRSEILLKKKEYYYRNKEKILLEQKIARDNLDEAAKGKARQRRRKYYHDHKTEIQKKRKDNAEYRKAYMKQYRLKNHEKIKRYMSKYRSRRTK